CRGAAKEELGETLQTRSARCARDRDCVREELTVGARSSARSRAECEEEGTGEVGAGELRSREGDNGGAVARAQEHLAPAGGGLRSSTATHLLRWTAWIALELDTPAQPSTRLALPSASSSLDPPAKHSPRRFSPLLGATSASACSSNCSTVAQRAVYFFILSHGAVGGRLATILIRIPLLSAPLD
ncbi:hypothetical protein RTBOTA2_005201, partial [Rhodotorula toruloides]